MRTILLLAALLTAIGCASVEKIDKKEADSCQGRVGFDVCPLVVFH